VPADGEPVREVRIAQLRAWLGPGVDPITAIGPDGDPDRLLTRPDCHVVKLQRKVTVGRVTTAAGHLYVKRYTVHAWRLALGSLVRASPARRAFDAARALAARGFGVPDVIAAVEERRLGILRRSFFVTCEVAGAVTADRYWEESAARRPDRRRFAAWLGDLFRRLHAAGVYHNDLKDVNVLVRPGGSGLQEALLDLERIRIGRSVSRRRRTKNLVQLDRTLGRSAGATARLRFLRAYLGPSARGDDIRAWAAAVTAAATRKDRRAAPPSRPPAVGIACAVVCQDEAEQIGPCLESARWCDEVVVVDGGSRDATVAIARRLATRVIENPWPGYRAQKQVALDATTEPWVLSLDADERVTPELATEIRAALGDVRDGVDGFAIPRLVPYLGRWWYRGGWWPRHRVRLVRRGRAAWGGVDPHDRLEVDGAEVRLRAPILHYTYPDVAGHVRSIARLTAVAAAEVPPGRRVGLARLLGEPAWRFVRSGILKRGFLEGHPGFFLAATDAFYVFLRWARVWDRERRA
jgi:Lipopolysaccharide kinase (Kdo/WaaP) family/Glycosyl transferase family 2